jgi:hypothetical protein
LLWQLSDSGHDTAEDVSIAEDFSEGSERKSPLPQKAAQKSTQKNTSKKGLSPVQNQADFFKKFGKNWRVDKNENGSVRRFFGSRIPIEDTSAETLTEWGQSFAPLLNLSSEDLSEALPIDPLKQEGTVGYRLPQNFSGYPVAGGDLRLFVDQERKAITGIDASNLVRFRGSLNNDVKPVQQILELARNSRTEVYISSDAIELIANEDQQPRLVYRGSSSPAASVGPKTETLLIDAQTGEILRREPVTHH